MSHDCVKSRDGRFEIRSRQKEYGGGSERGYNVRWDLRDVKADKTLESFTGDTIWAGKDAAAPEHSGVRDVKFSPDEREVIVTSYERPERRIDLLALTDPSRTGTALGETT